MSGSIFVTGATGLVGRRLVSRLAADGDRTVTCLSRETAAARTGGNGRASVRWVGGDLATPDAYERALAACDRVVHLAAATGRASRREYRRTNVEGTAALVDACRRVGTERFVHVSTIAVHFDDLGGYPYAASKAAAEEVVRGSGLDHVVVRPTLVLARDAPGWRSLSALARPPLTIVPGDGSALLQPIHVDDLARVLTDLARSTDPPLGAHDVGGPETISVRDLLGRVHRRLGGGEARFVHLPLGPLETAVTWLDRLLPFPPPVVPGQFYTFRQDGTVREGTLQERVADTLAGVDETIAACLDERRHAAGTGTDD